jgi:hypothetical protein
VCPLLHCEPLWCAIGVSTCRNARSGAECQRVPCTLYGTLGACLRGGGTQLALCLSRVLSRALPTGRVLGTGGSPLVADTGVAAASGARQWPSARSPRPPPATLTTARRAAASPGSRWAPAVLSAATALSCLPPIPRPLPSGSLSGTPPLHKRSFTSALHKRPAAVSGRVPDAADRSISKSRCT